MSGSGAAARLDIDLGAIAGNYRIIRRTASPAAVGGVVKADAYGLDATRVVPILTAEGCTDFFVAHLDEAVQIASIVPPAARMFILNGLPAGAEAECSSVGAIPVLNSIAQVERWSAHAAALGRDLPAALQFDTGMSRLGLPHEEAEALLATPALLRGLRIELVMSHLACGDEPGAPSNQSQKARFEAAVAAFPGVRRSLANSGGAFLPGFSHDLVRPGIALYGGAPQTDAANPMQPVVALHAGIIQVRTLSAGEAVGYGLDWTARRPSRIATIGVGYADGWPRALGNRGAAYIGGFRAAIAGRVSMDSITLDVSDVPAGAMTGAFPVELLGPNQTIDDVARDAGTISYEILTRLGRRYARFYRAPGQAREGISA